MGNCCSCDIESYGIESYGYHKDLYIRTTKYNPIKNTFSSIDKDSIEIQNQSELIK